MSGKRKVSVCIGHELANALYLRSASGYAICNRKVLKQNVIGIIFQQLIASFNIWLDIIGNA